jgi:hypothetical protein
VKLLILNIHILLVIALGSISIFAHDGGVDRNGFHENVSDFHIKPFKISKTMDADGLSEFVVKLKQDFFVFQLPSIRVDSGSVDIKKYTDLNKFVSSQVKLVMAQVKKSVSESPSDTFRYFTVNLQITNNWAPTNYSSKGLSMHLSEFNKQLQEGLDNIELNNYIIEIKAWHRTIFLHEH